MKQSWKSIILSSICLLILPGCWSQVEINDRTLVTGLFIDQGDSEEDVEVTILTSLTNRIPLSQSDSGGSGEKRYSAVSRKGKNIAEALQKIQSDLTRTLSWGHTRIIVVGNDYARHGLAPLFEWIARQPSFLLKTHLMVAPKKAKEITKLTPVYERNPAEVLREFADEHTVLSASVRDVLIGSFGGQGSAIPFLHIGEIPMVSEGGKKSPWAGIKGGAMFQGNQMMGTLNYYESQMIAWLQNSLIQPTFTIESKPNREVSIGMEKMSKQIRPALEGPNIHFRIHLYGEAYLISANTEDDLSDPAILRQLERQFEVMIKARLEETLAKSQQAGADILQLGRRIEWKYPQRWAEVHSRWPEVYKKQVQFDIKPTVTIKHYGTEFETIQSQS